MPESPSAPEVSRLSEDASSTPERSFLDEVSAIGRWLSANPFAAIAIVVILGSVAYFFGYLKLFNAYQDSALGWAWTAWDPSGNQEHGRLVVPIALGLIWYHRNELLAAKGEGSAWGLLPLLIGVGVYLLAVRCVQPRIALTAFPFLLFGTVWFVRGWASARIIAFPCAFLVFMVPVAALEQATFNLQFIITNAVGVLSKLFGIGIDAVGTTLTATNNAFNFEIAEGCSGIRSLAAMTMLTAVYVYLTQDRLWKQLVIFACSVAFALVGNIGRIFTVVLVARYYDPEFASGLYHDYSGYVFFPIAVVAMLTFSKLVNLGSKQKKTA